MKTFSETHSIFHRIAIVAALCFIAACSRKQAPREMNETFSMSDKLLSTTTTSEARLQPLKNELIFFGKITADNNMMIEVYPVVGGNVTKVLVELGDYVKKGQLLATIRSTEVAGFEKELEDAQTDVVVARNNLKAAQELFEGKLNTERDVLEARSHLDKANSQLARMQQTYQIYNVKPGAVYEVRSPLNGFIIQKNINEGMLLRSDKTDNIFDVAEIGEVWAIANVNESDIAQVRMGIDAEVTTLSYPDRKFTGKVDKIYNVIDAENKAMKARVMLDNPDFLLKPEMRCRMRFSYEEGREMIAVPSAAIIFDNSRYYVMVFRNRNDIETRQVELYRQVGDMSYVLTGLKEGEKVMTRNQLLVYDALND